MEIEYKWEMPDERTLGALLDDETIASALGEPRELHMRATYYDTANQDVYRLRGGLRVRRENDESVCCLKLAASADGACKARHEFEVRADDVIEGLRQLPTAGAPADICEMLIAGDPQPTCETDFTRREHTLTCADFTAALAIDVGEMRNHGRKAPIHEVELEHMVGSEEAFHAFARQMQEHFGLEAQPLSKLARAMAL
ncbi:MAG: CYTH domain-containing protein [Coriobacteriales bacterium]